MKLSLLLPFWWRANRVLGSSYSSSSGSYNDEYSGTVNTPSPTILPTPSPSSASVSSSSSTSSASSSSSSASSSSSSSSRSNNKYGAYGYNFFVDSQNTYYDGYQQAWRYLGWYVKCGYPSDRYDQQSSHSHSRDQNQGNIWQGNNYCQRYLIWAAYVDVNYQGGGIGEYYYYNPYSQSWDYSACKTHGNGRCAPMDCHLTNTTTWKLMGVFKEASYFGNDAFFEQLFKHEGYCVWNDDDLYDFMTNARKESWTQGCVQTSYQGNSYYFTDSSNSGHYLYLDLKPTWNGNMTYGLYTDGNCKTEYEGLDVSVETVSKGMGLLYGNYLKKWNDGLEIFKVCQPCMAYNLKNNYANTNRNLGNSYNYYNDPNAGYFRCDDPANWVNVNQCMKFRTHADLEVATWEDLVTATNQGGILEVDVGGTVFGSQRMSAEQWKYIQNQRRYGLDKQRQEYTQLQAEARRVSEAEMAAEAREKELMSVWRYVAAAVWSTGVLMLVFAVCRAFRTCRAEQDDETFSEPLI